MKISWQRRGGWLTENWLTIQLSISGREMKSISGSKSIFWRKSHCTIFFLDQNDIHDEPEQNPKFFINHRMHFEESSNWV